MPDNYRDYARMLLGAIRLVNGIIALFIPQMIIKRFDEDGTSVPVTRYALRMFGVRTVLVALDLFRGPGPTRFYAVKVAPIIHASDTVAAFLAARSGMVPTKTGVLIVAISTMNTILSLVMQGGGESAEPADAVVSV